MRTNARAATVILTVFTAVYVGGQEPPGRPTEPEASAEAPPPPAPTSAQSAVEEVIPTAESSVTEQEIFLSGWEQKRNPFWPFGYEAPVVVNAETLRLMQLKANAQWPKLEHSPATRLPSGDYITIVRGIGVIETGDIVRIARGNVLYRWRIVGISANGIDAQRLPLRTVRP